MVIRRKVLEKEELMDKFMAKIYQVGYDTHPIL
jgi:hypothetical protein